MSAVDTIKKLTDAQRKAVKKSIGGLDLRYGGDNTSSSPYLVKDSYVVDPTTNLGQDTSIRDTTYALYSQPGMFATAAPRATSPNDSGTNAILENIQNTMNTLRAQQFVPEATTQTQTRTQDIYYNPLEEYQDIYVDQFGGTRPMANYGGISREKYGLSGDDALLKSNLEALANQTYYDSVSRKQRDADIQGSYYGGPNNPNVEEKGFRLGDDPTQFLAGTQTFQDVITTPGQYRDYEVQYNRPDPNAAPSIETTELGAEFNPLAGQDYMDKLRATNLSFGNKWMTPAEFGDPGALYEIGRKLDQEYLLQGDDFDTAARNAFLSEDLGLGKTFNNRYYGQDINETGLGQDSTYLDPRGVPYASKLRYYTDSGGVVTPRSTGSNISGYTQDELDASSRALSQLGSNLYFGDELDSRYLTYGDLSGPSIPTTGPVAPAQSYKTLGDALATQRLSGILGAGAAKGLI